MIGSEQMEISGKVEVTAVTDSAGDEVLVIEETVDVVGESERPEHVEVSVERYGDGDHRRQHFRVSRNATLLSVLDEGARKLDEKLLPSPEEPLDHLRAVYRDHEAGPSLNLELTVGAFLKEKPVTHHFAIELVLAIRINTRWRAAPKKEMTPRAILGLAGLSPEEYSLYASSTSKEPLPPDTPIELHRGEHFEAQRDGKYGGTVGS
jgi:hypothetical protein